MVRAARYPPAHIPPIRNVTGKGESEEEMNRKKLMFSLNTY